MQRNMSGSLNGVIDEMLSGSVAGNIQFESTGGSTVTITPTLESGTKIADFTIDDTDGSLYAPTPEPPIEYTAGDNISISKENVISATDTTYTAGDNITIENGVISANTSGVNYSTDEHVIGTWINGKPLYERSYSFTNTISSFTDYVTLYNIPNIETVVKNTFTALRDLGQNEKLHYTGEGTSRPEHDVDYYINIREYNGNIQYRINKFGTQIKDMVITTQYTKTTDV